ncbi:MAG TPA: CRISPR-associated helicase Cas3' [Clostridiales bacterium]|nr:CRISPR-associated helicase Cas3' [Clostridiales bacterium]
MYKDFIARKRADGATQSLYEHSNNMVQISTDISHFPNVSKLLAYLHDLGKLSTDFQEYIKHGGERGSVIHAWQGAFLAEGLFQDDSVTAKLLKEIIGFCVSAHHNHLEDGVSPDGTANHFDKFINSSADKYSMNEIKERITEEEKAELQKLFEHAKLEIDGVLAQIMETYRNQDSANFALGLFIKYLYSCLIDADRLDAYLFNTNGQYKEYFFDWKFLIDVFEDRISQLKVQNEIDTIRKSVSEKCRGAADRETGIYQLSVPTGGGKTFSSFRFALHHCERKGKKRIIYVIPYLSVIDQTAKNLRNILGLPEDNEIIFEHHSNIVEPEDDEAAEIRKLAAARWDSPIILTTLVQFLETTMSAKSGKLRRFHSMADSVIIFDEIQSMPVKVIHCFNEVITFLSRILNTTVILCSATQPTLEQTQRKNLLLDDNVKLIDCKEDFKNIKRVVVIPEAEKDCESASDFILQKAKENGNCLVIVNTKKSALEIYENLKSKTAEFTLLHLSTSMCPAHRLQQINQMETYLKEEKKFICVSTQLIEAGVDVSFSCVVRIMAGLDSIAQAAGRCNRNGESPTPKQVYTFVLKGENLDMLPDIEAGKETTIQIIQSKSGGQDLLDEEIMTQFYKKYFQNKEIQMDYPIKEGPSVYAMLSSNRYGKENYRNQTGRPFPHIIPHAFRSAGENFRVIENNTKSVVVEFGESENLIQAYRKEPNKVFTKEKGRILKELQKYSVDLYEWQIKKLSEQKALYPLDEETGVIILAQNYYSQEVGVVMEADQDALIC